MDACKDLVTTLEMQLQRAHQERDQAIKEASRLSALMAAEHEYWADIVYRIPYSSLEEMIDDCERMKERLTGNMSGKGHFSQRFQELRQAAERFWKNADPDDATSHPKNESVNAHLQQLGWGSKMAEQGASIIRPTWSRRGRPERESP